jgi:hypothetical protein
MQNDWVLIIAEDEEVEAEDRRLLVEVGWPESGIRSARGGDALEFINSRLLTEKLRERPGLILFDLDHNSEAGRERLRQLMMALKRSETFKTLPLVMLLRPGYNLEDVAAWYSEGVNAVALRPNHSGEDARQLFRSLSAFWRDTALLPDTSWDRRRTPPAS